MSYVVVANLCLRFLSGIFLSSGCWSFLAKLFRVLLHIFPMYIASGNGFSVVYLFRYCLSISAVSGFSLKLRDLCPLHPCALIIPCCLSMLFLVTVDSSCPSNPVSSSIVNIVAYFFDVLAIIFLCVFVCWY